MASPPPGPSAETALLAARLEAQLLAGAPATDPQAVVARLLAVQGQDARGARLAVRARSRGLAASDVDRGLTEGSLLITWLNRGTLHLVASQDYPWLHALTAPTVAAANARRLAQEGVTAGAGERGVRTIERALAREGPLVRRSLRERLQAAGVPTAGQALVHVLMLASLRGRVVRGPMVGREHAYALVADWLPGPRPFDRGQALAELARRYLRGHGPAGERDLAQWAGLPLRDARAGLNSIGSELELHGDGLVDLRGREASAPLPPPRLLGAFDPVLLGWRSREVLLAGHPDLVTTNGLFRPFALVRGRAAGVWGLRAGSVALTPFRPLPRAVAAALEREAADVGRFLAGA